MNKIKLTKPQEQFLKSAARKIGAWAIVSYPPLKKLLSLGFVDNGDNGKAANRFLAGYWFATNKGREWLGVLPKPLMDVCEECDGKGEVQQSCECCGTDLTDANWKPEYESYICTRCFKENHG